MSRPAPHALWQQAQGDRDRYRQLMREYGHLKPACGSLDPDSGDACKRDHDHPDDYHEWRGFDCQERRRWPVADRDGGRS